MLYSIRHVTRFRYADEVRESVMEVMMQPRAEGNQRLLSFALQTTPRAQVLAYNDHLGNIVHHFDVLRPHTELLIEAQCQVEVGAPVMIPQTVPAEAWNALDPARLHHEEFDMLALRGMAQPTERLMAFIEKYQLARLADPLSTVQTLSKAVYEAFEYDSKATKVDSPIDHALELESGVCQDFSHILIACSRLFGVPARYVSGYLHHRKGIDARPSPDATHAWVEAFIPEYGWVGFDPTNGVLASERHIRVAVGLDYNDVPPTRGVYKGKTKSELAYAVSVLPADAPTRPSDRLKIVKPLDLEREETPEDVAFHQHQQQQQ